MTTVMAEGVEGVGGKTYITIIIFWGVEGELKEGGGGEQPLRCLWMLAACCVKSILLHLTLRPSRGLCDIERQEGPFLFEERHSNLLSLTPD